LHIDLTAFLRHHAEIPMPVFQQAFSPVKSKSLAPRKMTQNTAQKCDERNRRVTKRILLSPMVWVLAFSTIAMSASPIHARATQSSSSATQCTGADHAPADVTSATPIAQETPPAKTAGMVWVNTDTGVYHKPGSRWYGKSKHGKYMLEVDAIKAGYKPAK
jgi:hypothetical protein